MKVGGKKDGTKEPGNEGSWQRATASDCTETEREEKGTGGGGGADTRGSLVTRE